MTYSLQKILLDVLLGLFLAFVADVIMEEVGRRGRGAFSVPQPPPANPLVPKVFEDYRNEAADK